MCLVVSRMYFATWNIGFVKRTQRCVLGKLHLFCGRADLKLQLHTDMDVGVEDLKFSWKCHSFDQYLTVVHMKNF